MEKENMASSRMQGVIAEIENKDRHGHKTNSFILGGCPQFRHRSPAPLDMIDQNVGLPRAFTREFVEEIEANLVQDSPRQIRFAESLRLLGSLKAGMKHRRRT
jgi:hypothetical protein